MAVAKPAAIAESPSKPGTTEAAESLIRKYHETEDEIQADLTLLRKQLADIEASAGTRVLNARISGDDKALSKVSGELSDVRSKIETLESALYPCRCARQAAEKDLKLSQANDLRNRAADLRKEAHERKKKTNELLQQLAAHENVGYVPRGASRTQILLAQANELEGEAQRTEAWANASPPVLRRD